MGYYISYIMTGYIYQDSFGIYKGSKNYKHHNKCGLCGNGIELQYGKEIIMSHIKLFHPEKLILLDDEEAINDEYTSLLNKHDRLEFDLFKLQIIESSLNGAYKGLKHPRYNAIFMRDNQQVLRYQMNKVKQQILSYDLNYNSFIPIMSYENLDGLN
jgi:hypothetical protein